MTQTRRKLDGDIERYDNEEVVLPQMIQQNKVTCVSLLQSTLMMITMMKAKK
jgi:hypothetical protein